jgi:hypothetical protein
MLKSSSPRRESKDPTAQRQKEDSKMVFSGGKYMYLDYKNGEYT